jgi:hypothetical protein
MNDNPASVDVAALQRRLKAYTELETEIMNAYYMTQVATKILDDLPACKEKDFGPCARYLLTQDQLNLVDFVLVHTEELVSNLRDKYYACLEGDFAREEMEEA